MVLNYHPDNVQDLVAHRDLQEQALGISPALPVVTLTSTPQSPSFRSSKTPCSLLPWGFSSSSCLCLKCLQSPTCLSDFTSNKTSSLKAFSSSGPRPVSLIQVPTPGSGNPRCERSIMAFFCVFTACHLKVGLSVSVLYFQSLPCGWCSMLCRSCGPKGMIAGKKIG